MNRDKKPGMETVKIGGITYTVSKEPDLQGKSGEWGHIEYKTGKIVLDDSVSQQIEDQTLIHEIAHGMLVEAGYVQHEEEQADRIGKMLDEIDRLKKDKIKRELTDEAIKSLSSRKLPVNDKVLSFVVKDTADDTLQAISDFESIISEIKAEYTQSEPPKMSSSFGGESTTKSHGDIFRGSRIIK
ncbi:DUF4355 domain-containing protein [Streptococcus suis]|nr:DUF4355 domain-containing protein [Streptococcus suis]NQI93218.1 DUF4355 domain-containing protein [Streptococcus suis]NQJ01246.1 DUF4355 domain-containing protein [Streptococcus suis]